MDTQKKKLTKDEALSFLQTTKFKRIAEKIEFLWGTPELQQYFHSITLIDREHREGFPVEVFFAIMRLYNISEGFDSTDVWDNNI